MNLIVFLFLHKRGSFIKAVSLLGATVVSGFAQNFSWLTLDPQKAITQYSYDTWHYDEGLPQSAVQSIAQTPDGYLWLGLEEGLARFDGVQFTLFHKDNTDEFIYNDVPGLLVDRAGNLWIGTDGGGLLRFKDGKFTAFTTKEGLAGDVIETIYQDRQGVLWVGTNHGLSQWRDGKFTNYTTQDGLSENVVLSLCQDRAGNLWIGTHGGGLNCYKEGRFKIYTTNEGLANDVVWAIHEDKTGKLWIGTNGGGLQHLYQKKFTSYTTKDGLTNDFVRVIFEDSAGSLWIGTRGGLNRWREGSFTSFSTKQGLSNDFVKTICEDREGSLWIGTYGGGLNRLRDGKFTNYSTSEGLSNNMVWTVYEDKAGNLWLGTDRGLNRFKDGKFTIFATPKGNGPNRVNALHEDRAGNLWIGTGGEGLYRLRHATWTLFTAQNGLASNFVRAVLEDRQGRLWIGTDNGLNLFQDGKFRIYRTKDGLSNDEIRYLHEDKAGGLWIGTRAGGLNRFKDGQFTIYTTKDGLSSDLIRPIYEDQEGALWIGTDGGGLSRFKDGKFTRYTIKEGLFDDSIFQILEDDRDNFWMSCNKGIFRISRQELNDFAEGKITSITSFVYGKDDGMKTSECNGASQPAGWRTREGKLWFPTIHGVVMIDPNNLQNNPLPPPVMVERLMVDHQPVTLAGKINLAPGNKSFEFHYTGLSLAAPRRVKFKYKLEKFDRDWIDAGTRRVAYYTNIPPGDYTFRVLACNNDGVWNETGAALAFSLQPYFYQTKFFYFFCLLAFILTGTGAYRFRMQQIRRREQELGLQVDERTQALQQEIHWRQQAQEALRRANDELENRVQERTAELVESNHALRKSEEQFRLLFGLAPIGMAITALDGKILRVNYAFCHLLGYTSEEALELTLTEMTHPDDLAVNFDLREQVLRGEIPGFQMEKRLIAKDGRIIYAILQAMLVRDSQGQPLHFIGQIVDISARKQAEEALQESEQRWLFALDGSGDGVWDWNVQTGKVFYSKRWKVMLGYDEHEIGETLEERSSRVHPDDWAMATENLQQHLHGAVPVYVSEHRVRCKDGSYKWMLDRGKIMARGADGRPLRVVGTHTDITYRKRSEEEIRRLNEKLEQRVLERTGALRATNVALEHEIAERQRAQQQLQYRTTRIIAHQAALLELAKSDHSDFNAALNWITAVDAKTLKVERVSYWAFTEDRSAIICKNLYKLSEERYEQGLQLEACQYPRYFQAMEASRLIAADDACSDPRTSEFAEGYLKPAGIVSMMDVPVWLRGKMVGIVCHEHIGALRHWTIEEQDFVASIADMISLALEVAERKRTEMALQESEGRIRQLAENINEVLWMEALDTRKLLYVSPGYEKIWGHPCESLYEQPNSFLESVHPDDVENFKAHLGNQRRGHFSEMEYRIVRPDGSIRWIWDRSFPILNGNGHAYRSAGVAEDVTERKRLEEQIRRHSEDLEEQVKQRTARIQELERQRAESEKLAAAGRIAARIAHEINNPLAGIKNSFLLIKDAVPRSHQYYDYVGRIEKEIDRIARIIRQMFDLHRPERESVRRFRLDETVEDVVVLLKSSSHEHGVTLESETSLASAAIVLPEGLIRQVLYNLVQNAIEASPPGSVVNISAAVATDQIVIKVADHGHGIPEALRPHIFEPFFTTKTGLLNGGLGLGLSITQSVVEAMNGSLDFESAAGQGTVFRITLPLGNNEEKLIAHGSGTAHGNEFLEAFRDPARRELP